MSVPQWAFKRRRFALLLLVSIWTGLLLVASADTAFAHPLGNFTINRYAGLLVRPDSVAIDYVIDMAEIPAYQEITQQIDANRDGQTDEIEMKVYRKNKCAEMQGHLALTLDGRAQSLTLTDMTLEFPPGAGGLSTLRLTCAYRTETTWRTAQQALFRDTNFLDRIGWREIVIRGDGVAIRDSTAPATSISDRLRSYPNDLLSNPLHQDEARFSFDGAAPSSAGLRLPSGPSNAPGRSQDSLAALVTADDLSWQVVLVSLVVAMGLGALHAVSPGHGKTIMAAYLVGTRGNVTQALTLGLTVTLTHTAGVLALGWMTLFASHLLRPEGLYPWLTLFSGTLATGMGVALAVSRWRMLRRSHNQGETHHGHEPPHHPDGHAPGEHENAGEHAHPDDLDPVHGHTHHPSDLNGRDLAWPNLIGLGLIGGLVPSTSALVLLLSAIVFQRIPFGIILIAAFGLGMAIVLVGIGVALVHADHLFERRHLPLVLLRVMPILSALVVIGAGLFVMAQAISQMGL